MIKIFFIAFLLLISVIPAKESSVTIILGDKLFQEKQYALALEQYGQYCKESKDSAATAPIRLRMGDCFYRMEDYPGAIDHLTLLLENLSAALVPKALSILAESHQALLQNSKAAYYFERLYNNYPGEPNARDALYKCGLAYYGDKQLERARDALVRFQSNFPKERQAADACYYLGEMAFARGDNDEAIRWFNRCIFLYADRTDLHVEAHYYLAKAYSAIGDADKTAQEYRLMVARYDTLASFKAICREYGDDLFQRENYEEAIPLYRKYLDRVGTRGQAETLFRLAEALFLTRQFPDALKGYEAYLVLDTLSGRRDMVLLHMARCHLALRAPEWAVERLEAVAGGHGEEGLRAQALHELGDLYFNDSLYRNAAAAYQRYLALSQTPDRDEVSYRSAWMLENVFQKPREATREYARFVQDFPSSRWADDARMAVARCEERLGDFDNALLDYRAVMEECPGSPLVSDAALRMEYVRDFARRDLNGAAESLLVMGVSQPDGTDARDLFTAVDILEYRLKSLARAQALLEDYRKKFPDALASPKILFRMAGIHEKRSRKAFLEEDAVHSTSELKAALSLYKELLRTFPNDMLLEQVRFRLLEIDRGTLSQYIAFLKSYPTGPQAAAAAFHIALAYQATLTRGKDSLLPDIIDYYQRAAAADSTLLPDAWFHMAEAYRTVNKSSSAEVRLRELVRCCPGYSRLPEAWFRLGEIAMNASDYPKAYAAFRQVVYRFPFSEQAAPSALRCAECLFRARDIQGALREYRSYALAYPKDSSRHVARLGVGRCLEYLNRDDLALREYRVLIQEGGVESGLLRENRLAAARVYTRLGDLKGAADEYRFIVPAIGRGERGDDVCREFAEVLYAQQNFIQAERYFAFAFKGANSRRDSIAALCGAIRAELMQGKTAEAKERKSLFKDRFPEAADPLAEMTLAEGLSLFNRGEYDKAEKRFRYISDKYPKSDVASEAQYQIGLCLYFGKERAAAMKELNRFCALFPDHPQVSEAELRMGRIAFDLGDYSGAVERFLPLIEKGGLADATYSSACEQAAMAYEKMSDWKKAFSMQCRYLERLSSGAPDPEALLRAGFFALQAKEAAAALPYFRQAKAVAPTDKKGEAAYWTAQALSAAGNTRSAIREYLEVASLTSAGGMWSKTAQLEAAALYEKTGDTENAKKLYEKMIREDGKQGRFGKAAVARLSALSIRTGSSEGKD